MPTIAFSSFKGIVLIEFIQPHVIPNTYDSGPQKETERFILLK